MIFLSYTAYFIYSCLMLTIRHVLAYQEVIYKSLGSTSNCISDQQNMWQTIGASYINQCSINCIQVDTGSFSALLVSSDSNSGIQILVPTTLLTNPYSIIGVDLIYKEGANNQLRLNLNDQASTVLTVQSPTIYEQQNQITCSSTLYQFYKASLIFQGTISSSTFFVSLDQNQVDFAIKQIRIWTNCCQNCLQCSSSTTCLTCMPGFSIYTFPTGEQVCQQTSGCTTVNCYSCAQLNGQEVCISCQPGYYLDTSNLCQTNDMNGICSGQAQYLEQSSQVCQSYSSNCWYQISLTNQWIACGSLENYQNYKCPFNKQVLVYYYQNYGIYQCSCLISNCEYCTQQSGCTQCQSGYNFDASTNTCDLNCSSSQYFDSSTRTCVNCGQNCQICNSSGCLTCNNSNYYINSSSPQDCQLCTIQNCQGCLGDGTCQSCQNGFQLSQDKSTCNIICNVQNCQTCNPQNGQICTTCLTNYQLSSDQSTCFCQVSNCNQCQTNDGLKCQICQTGYILNASTLQCDCTVANCQSCNSSNGTLCDTCITNYLLSQDKQKCSCQVINCQSCQYNDGNICSSCISGYVLNPNKNQCNCAVQNCQNCNASNGALCDSCAQNYLLSSDKTSCSCQVYGCQTCQANNGLACQTCNSDYFLNSTNKQCNCAANHCQVCDPQYGTVCLTCVTNFILTQQRLCYCAVRSCRVCNQDNGAQCSMCSPGYLLNSTTFQCDCQIQNCQTCNVTNGTLCQTCVNNYLLSTDQTKCSCQVANCLQCSPQDGSKCQVCQNNFLLSTDQTKCTCQVANCSQCTSQDGNICQTCVTNYLLGPNSKSCNCQVQNCLKCNSQDGSICQTCVNNYLLSQNFKSCSCQVANCSQCSQLDGLKCSICQNNYLLSSDQTKCSCQVANCSKCSISNGSVCQTCATNYLLSSNSMSCTCQVANCSQCISNDGTKCQVCQTGYVLNQSSYTCSCSDQNCLSCSLLDGSICLQCPSGYTLEAQTNSCKLTACQVQNCQTCQVNNVYGCSQCNHNFYLNKNQTSCLQCSVFNCNTCIQADFQQCFICNQGFQIDQNNQCQIISNNNQYTVNPIASLIGYSVKIQFQRDLVNVSVNQDIQDLTIQIPGYSKYNYTVIVSSINQITININCFENIKNANIFINFQLSQLVSQNSISNLSYNTQLPAFVIVSQQVQQTVAQISSATQAASKTIVSSYLPIAFFGNFYFLVNMIDLTNFLYYLLFLDIRYPINVTDFYGLFKDFQFPFVPNLFTYLYDPSYNPRSPQKFMDMGTNSYLISNSGQAICICFYIFSVYILAKLAHRIIKIRRVHAYLTRVLYETWEFSSFFDMMSAEYVYILIGCLLQSLNFDTSDKNSYIVNYMLYAFFMPFCIIWPIFILAFLYKQKNLKSNEYLLTKLQSFLGGLRIENENPYFDQNIKEKEDQKQSQNNTQQSKENHHKNIFQHLESEHIKQSPKPNEIIQELAEEEQMASPEVIKKKQLSNEIHQQKVIHLRQISEMTNISSKARELDLITYLQIDIRSKRQKLIAKYSKLFSSFLYIRKILFSFIIVLLHGYCYLQISLISFLNLVVIFLIAYIQPYDCLSENIKNASSEVILIAIQMCAATLVEDSQDDNEERRINVGWAIVCLSAFALLWNTLVLAKETVVSFYQSFKKLLLTQESEQQKNQIYPITNQMEIQKSNLQNENQNKFLDDYHKKHINSKVIQNDVALKRKRSSFSSYRNQLNSIVSDTLIPYPQSQVMTPSSLGSFAINTERIDQKIMQAKEIDEKHNIQNCKTEIVSVENNFIDDFNYTSFSPKISFVDSSHAIKLNKVIQNNLNQSGSIIQKRRRRSTNFKKDDISFLLNQKSNKVNESKNSSGNSPENNLDLQPQQNKKSSFSEYSNNKSIKNTNQIDGDLQNKEIKFINNQKSDQKNQN
ncbi:hypothetical protein TTHERM_01178720 (macronuclear) [Tetrahymena thermophila SB210]|uniref:EGF-like domain-containing protein n=1 Tax=Tetrahymena thermophila (strain SB210) TaxID=312017 RepID=Q22KY3_TETTS|nr:hypothetical protein TTHERM_01178720 [Tetrahymena thermophila SB210]EAR85945.2 hypothetical protein TTHERM_01178720 [Tetrahymena thermophila SB210]|eukprot:XP_976540.2 hypothetical protein TTHERM_01178720 [Tetrahymena thermophila SB210]